MNIKQKQGTSLKLKTRTLLLISVGSGISLLLFAVFFGYLNVGVKKEALAAGNETLSSGSFIINMGIEPQTHANGLKPYGLVYELIKDHNVPVKWVISTTKPKNGVDINHNSVPYKGGTFVVPAEYITPAISTVIENWRTKGVSGNYAVSSFVAPVYMDITSFPLVMIDLLSGNDSIIAKYFQNAEIPSAAYEKGSPATTNVCHDMWVNPHGDPTWATHSYLYDFVTVHKSFIWMQCHAVSVMEYCSNFPSIPAKQLNYLTTSGLQCYQAGKCGLNPQVHAKAIPSPTTYAFPNDPVAQFMGGVAGGGGSERWFIPITTGGWRPTTTRIVKVGATVSPIDGTMMAYGPAFGDPSNGYVMYQGGHDMNADGSVAEQVAAQRAFFNFLLLAGKTKAPTVSAPAIGGSINANATATYTATVTGGFAPYSYQWTSSNGGTFSNPNGPTTDYTAPHTEVPSTTIIRCIVTDGCGRKNFISQFVIINASPLPIELLDFSAEFDKKSNVLVKWSTAAELNIKYYTIDRSADGLTWNTLKNFPVNGNSNQLRTYAFLDEFPLKGTSFYRLSQKELSGHVEIQGVEKVESPKESTSKNKLVAGPNPFTDHINVTFGEPLQGTTSLRLFNSAGRVVYETTYTGTDNRITLDIPTDLRNGTYILQAVNGDEEYKGIKLIKY